MVILVILVHQVKLHDNWEMLPQQLSEIKRFFKYNVYYI